MNYYDEEIAVGPSEPIMHLNNIKVDKLPNKRSSIKARDRNADSSEESDRREGGGERVTVSRGGRPFNMQNPIDDDGLLHDILDHDDDDDDDDDDPLFNDSYAEEPTGKTAPAISSTSSRLQSRPSSSRQHPVRPTSKRRDDDETPDDASETESDEILGKLSATTKRSSSDRSGQTANEIPLNLTPEKWESLSVPKEVKDLFSYILKYAPQNIETPYQLQPFIPDYVPAVGDVDGFLKVTVPPLLQQQRQQEISEHLDRMGLYFLDEPSGEQSEPSLLNMKLRSLLTGSGANGRRFGSAQAVPIAKSSKDIDKWITEVEEVHMTQSVFDVQPSKDIEALLMDWPRSFAAAKSSLLDAYQHAQQGEIPLTDYIRVLCEKFAVDCGTGDTQVDFIKRVHSLFAMYLAANQAWD